LRTNLEISHIDKYIQFDADKELNELYDKLKSKKEDKKNNENSISLTKEKDSRARQQILCLVSKETKAMLIGLRLKSAYDMYKYLENEYNIINNNKVPDLYDRLKNLRAKTDKEVIKFTTEFEHLCNLLQELGKKIDEDEKFKLLLKGLPGEYKNYVKFNYKDNLQKIANEIRTIAKRTINAEDLKPVEEISFIKNASHNHSQNSSRNNNYHNNYNNNNNNNYNNNYNNNNRRIRNQKNNKINRNKTKRNNERYCSICDKHDHFTRNCYFNARNPNNKIKEIARKFSNINLAKDTINNFEIIDALSDYEESQETHEKNIWLDGENPYDMSPELPMNNPHKPNDLIINYLRDYNKPKTNPINYNISNESIYD